VSALRQFLWPSMPPNAEHWQAAQVYSRRATTCAGLAVAFAIVSLTMSALAGGFS
jgi:hypothetical protein